LDIDYFKKINDHYGHDAGDEVLVAMASVLMNNSRSSDMVGRWGGEEFLILVPQTRIEVCTSYAEKLRQAVKSCVHPRAGSVSASFGVTEFREDDTANSLIKRADQALYRAKEGGRDRVVASADHQETVRE
jgi:diguanylate cyclase (GGDEF)-like protein